MGIIDFMSGELISIMRSALPKVILGDQNKEKTMANVSDILLQAAMDHEVSEKLNGIIQQSVGDIKSLPKEDQEKILTKLKSSCDAYIRKMQLRLESKGD